MAVSAVRNAGHLADALSGRPVEIDDGLEGPVGGAGLVHEPRRLSPSAKTLAARFAVSMSSPTEATVSGSSAMIFALLKALAVESQARDL